MTKKSYRFFQVRLTTVITGKIAGKNENTAESEFRKDLLDILKSNGYSVKIVSNLKKPRKSGNP
jgi:hypothetical protein